MGAGCGMPLLQLLVSHAMEAMDTAESRSSGLMSEGCEGKGRKEETSEGKKNKEVDGENRR